MQYIDLTKIKEVNLKPKWLDVFDASTVTYYCDLLKTFKEKKEELHTKRVEVRRLEAKIDDIKDSLTMMEPFFDITYQEKEVKEINNKCYCIAEGDPTNGGRSWSE